MNLPESLHNANDIHLSFRRLKNSPITEILNIDDYFLITVPRMISRSSRIKRFILCSGSILETPLYDFNN